MVQCDTVSAYTHFIKMVFISESGLVLCVWWKIWHVLVAFGKYVHLQAFYGFLDGVFFCLLILERQQNAVFTVCLHLFVSLSLSFFYFRCLLVRLVFFLLDLVLQQNEGKEKRNIHTYIQKNNLKIMIINRITQFFHTHFQVLSIYEDRKMLTVALPLCVLYSAWLCQYANKYIWVCVILA